MPPPGPTRLRPNNGRRLRPRRGASGHSSAADRHKYDWPMFTVPKIMEMESPSAGTLVHIFASVSGESRSSWRKRLRNEVEPHRLRRTQEGWPTAERRPCLGPEALALAALWNKEMGLSYGVRTQRNDQSPSPYRCLDGADCSEAKRQVRLTPMS
jgi:hypothetical protein